MSNTFAAATQFIVTFSVFLVKNKVVRYFKELATFSAIKTAADFWASSV